MAIAITWKSSIYNTTAAATYTAAPTWTPTANSLLVALVCGTSTTNADPTGVTGHGITYSKLTLGTSSLSTTHQLSIWVAKAGATPTSVAAVATWGTNRTGGVVINSDLDMNRVRCQHRLGLWPLALGKHMNEGFVSVRLGVGRVRLLVGDSRLGQRCSAGREDSTRHRDQHRCE